MTFLAAIRFVLHRERCPWVGICPTCEDNRLLALGILIDAIALAVKLL